MQKRNVLSSERESRATLHKSIVLHLGVRAQDLRIATLAPMGTIITNATCTSAEDHLQPIILPDQTRYASVAQHLIAESYSRPFQEPRSVIVAFLSLMLWFLVGWFWRAIAFLGFG